METQDITRPASFTITTDFNARLFRFKFVGLWEKETYDRYTQAALVEMKKFRDAGLAFDGLGDLTEFLTQPQYLNEVRQDFSKTARNMGLRKCAVVVASVLVKSQVNRLIGTYRFFGSEKEAIAWIRQ